MSDFNNSNSSKRWSASTRKIGWAILIVLTLYVCYFSRLGALGFVGPDEPRYAWIARDMAETGDWVTPRLYGHAWFEKPPLYYWGAALSFKLFGVSEAAARLPSAFSALLATLALAWLAWRMYGGETARWLLLLLPTTVGMIGFSHAAATDMPFSAMLTIAMVCAAVALRLIPQRDGRDAAATATERASPVPANSATPWLALILFGFFLGAAVLAKGPAGIILCGGAVLLWAIVTKRWRDAFRMFHPAAVVAFFLTALPWYILCARRNPDFFRIFIIEHNFERYLTPEFRHIQPFWFYGPIALLALLPWTLLLLGCAKDAWRAWKGGRWRDSTGLFFSCWAAFTIAFFTLSNSKLPGYILPAIPPLGVLIARTVFLRVRCLVPGRRWPAIASGLTLFALATVTMVDIQKIPFAVDYFPPAPLGIVLLSVCFIGILVLILGLLKRTAAAFLVSAFAVSASLLLSLTGDAQWSLDAGVSARTAAGYVRSTLSGDATTLISIYNLNRSEVFGLDFYLHRELGEWTKSESKPGWVLTDYAGGHQLQELGLSCPPSWSRAPITICQDPGLGNRTAGRGKTQ